MSIEDSKIVKSDQTANGATIDKSRRSFSKAGVVAPVIMTLTSKVALGDGYYCTISGMQSGNMSSHTGGYQCGVGFSPGGWWQNATKTGNQDGNLNQWCSAGVTPFTIQKVKINNVWVKQVWYQNSWKSGNSWTTIYNKIFGAFGANAQATTFKSVFGGSDARSLWDVLDTSNGSLEWHAIADYLNAKLNQVTGQFNPAYQDITPAYIIGVYNSSLSDAEKKAYFELIHH